MTNEQLANRLMAQVQFNDALDETCRALMEEVAEKLRDKPAASTPVAGDAVLSIVDKWMASYDHLGTGSDDEDEISRREWEEDRAVIVAALAQDRGC